MGALGPLGERETSAAAGHFKATFDSIEAGAVAELVPDVSVDVLRLAGEAADMNLRCDPEDPSAVALLVDDVDGVDFARHEPSPSQEEVSGIECALRRIRNYATQSGMAPTQVLACFLAGAEGG